MGINAIVNIFRIFFNKKNKKINIIRKTMEEACEKDVKIVIT